MEEKDFATKSITTVTLPSKMLSELDEIARAVERSRSYIVNKAIVEYLERHRSKMIATIRSVG